LFSEEERNQCGETFEEIFKSVWKRFSRIKGFGKLTIYDIAASICRKKGILITKVHIIGEGPIRAIRILNQPLQFYKIGQIKLYYVNVEPLREIFQMENNDGDWWETYLCRWQKTQ
jgi:hypothetical protein